METKPTSFRLSERCRSIIREWSAALGVSDADVIEMWARVIQREGFQVPADFVRQGVGRPRKLEDVEPTPKRGRGRPRKQQ